MAQDGTHIINIPGGADTENCARAANGDLVAINHDIGVDTMYLYPHSGGSRFMLLNTSNGTNDPVISNDGSLIAYVQTVGGNHDIYTMHPDGSNILRMTSNAGDDSEPAISKDGSKIAFVSFRNAGNNGDIYTVNTDGSNETHITNTTANDEYPAFSPDGTKIVFSQGDDSATDLYIMNADGSNIVRLTNTIDNEYAPSFSIDGSRIFFAINNKGGPNQGIGSCKPDGSDYKVIDNVQSDWKGVGFVY